VPYAGGVTVKKDMTRLNCGFRSYDVNSKACGGTRFLTPLKGGKRKEGPKKASNSWEGKTEKVCRFPCQKKTE